MKSSIQSKPTTRSRILEAGIALMSQSGLSGVTVGVLAEQVGMSKSGLFAHFGSKEEVQIALLNYTAEIAKHQIIDPAMRASTGRPRLEATMRNWLGWTARIGLPGGCPIAAGMFEVDDSDGPVRQHISMMEREWRAFLEKLAEEAIDVGHFNPDLNVDQFVWELCAIYLGHHVSLRFNRDPDADSRALEALKQLLNRASSETTKPAPKRKNKKKLLRRANLNV